MDFLSGIFKPLADAWASVEGALVGTPQLAGIGLILLIGAAFAVAVLGIAALVLCTTTVAAVVLGVRLLQNLRAARPRLHLHPFL